MVQPLTAKELEYIVDSMSNEDLLIKQTVVALSHSQTPAVQQLFNQLSQQHKQHYQQLLTTLQQHAPLAPKLQ
ncbi:hypothetical protein RCG23_09515 [Neobacillus sp. PS3-34]|uniref:hypothetical protein n=1 Tax=Neobacillus sp. PS3-34 TaxID=3070678 RepID=UPI0027E124DB|nr:hypothetical protein [Neobacillus sp. PS3-34]WML50055.1 hypothetical protein RCG23_09515 [Neobacillus sp. PS3-34]